MEDDKRVKVQIEVGDERMELINEQAELLNVDPLELLGYVLAKSLQKQAKERGKELHIQGIDFERKN